MEDSVQDGVSSPATPGASKSKLDTLPKEDLIKFAKKQMMLIQKVKARCTELEKEIEVLKSNPLTDEADVVQALSERLDSVLLEKAETHQQLVTLKKEYAKSKHDAEESAMKIAELQEQYELSSNSFAKEIEELKGELLQSHCKHKEEIEVMASELKNAIDKQSDLTDILSLKESQEAQMRKLTEEVQLVQLAYEEQISNLQKALINITEEKNLEIAKLVDEQEDCSKQHSSEIQNLHSELLKVKSLYQEEVSDLMQKLEVLTKENEQEKDAMQILVNQYVEKEKVLIAEIEVNNQKHELEMRLLREKLERNSNVSEMSSKAAASDDKVAHFESVLKDLDSQHSLLKDELIYTNSVKAELEMEVQHLKNECFHEREELEFKINELQLAIEDYNGLIEKLKSQLEATSEDYERQKKQHVDEIQAIREQNKKEISELKKTITLSFEKDQSSFACELQLLKKQCNKLQQEKDEAVSSYENLRETLVTLQAELGESAGKISHEFEAMKQQQATDVSELQQKLRAAYREKNDLLETVNRLQVEAEQLSCKKTECEELLLQISTLQQKNEDVIASLQQKDDVVKDLEVKISETSIQNEELMAIIKSSSEEISKLQEICKSEQNRALTLQQEAEKQAKLNNELMEKLKEMEETLQVSVNNLDQPYQEPEILKQKLETTVHDKERLEVELKKFHDDILQLNETKDIMSKEYDDLMSKHRDCFTLREELEKLRNALQTTTEERDQITNLLEREQNQAETIKAQLFVLKETLLINVTEEDLCAILKAISETVFLIKEEKQNALLQNNEKSVQLQRLQEDSDAQCAELRAVLSDYSKEKELLRHELEENVADKEALQKDLLEMKNALEKVKLENDNLLSNVESLNVELENIKQKEAEELQQASQKVQEDVLCSTENTEAERNALLIELASVKEMLSESKAIELEHQSCIIELQSKLENRAKEAKDKEEKLNKIKAVAIKAKKELDSNKKEAQSIREELEQVRAERDRLASSMKDVVHGAEGYQNLLKEYDRQLEQLETERDRSNNAERQVEELCRQLHAAAVEQEKLTSTNEDLVTRIDTLQSNNKLLEAQILEMQRAKAALDKEFEAERVQKEQKVKEVIGYLIKVECGFQKPHLSKRIKLSKSYSCSFSMKHPGDRVRKMNISWKASLQATIEQYEERNTKMKQLLVKNKKELADCKQAESDLLILQASLKGELEASQQQVEAYKIQVAELTSEKHKAQEQLRVQTEQQQRATHNYQQRLSALQEECNAAKAEQAAVTSEFESYKVRVHNVLKQQKNKSASQAEQEVFRQEREHLQTTLDQLKAKLLDTQHTLQLNAAELQTLQSEHDILLERHNKMIQETVAKEAELREKLCTAQSENMLLKTEHAQTVSQMSAQIEAQRNSFKDQVRHFQEDHRKTVETLQQQLSKIETQLFQAKSEATVTSSQQPLKSLRERRPTDLPLLDLYSVAREDGEGMETTDIESVSSTSTHFASLEQLLSSSEIRTEPPHWEPELSKEELTQRLNTTSKSVDHLSGLLHETEATNAILMEQITLLKNEIRRLERNQEREKSVANLEYLKNVLLQFIFLKAGSERQRLLPVIDTMLQLSPEERGKLVAIAQGEEEAASHPAGWSSYLHSWSGLR
ncbi:GRIP and coiled-coil domain-containing protein 2 [Bombina bombina]|uniref:GRIP and coiled-coil domain-containing protein 2 n=1 Tax=Bombina bombina TaxID=8345 RepID=UPI00235AA708|nr:GRIP and coiled-coil domain-containing protein 2 [Bombina bombina]